MAPRPHGRAAVRLGSARLPLIGALLALALALIGGCDDEDGNDTTATANGSVTTAPSSSEVRVTLSDRVVRPGQSFSAAVVNDADIPVTYGAGYKLERRTRSGEFVEFPIRPQPIPDIGLVAEPGETGPEVEVEVPERARSGIYRIILNASVQGDRLSATFRVRR